MYSEWVSLNHTLRADKRNRSVLRSFPRHVGREIAHTIVTTLIQDQGLPDKKKLSSSSEVDWVMEVFCYGLSLPMTETDGEIIKGCVNVYIEWLGVMLMEDRDKVIPEPLLKEPVKYVQKIFQHLKNLFLIRNDNGSNLALQASLCIRVLQFFKVIASESQLSPEIWDALLCLMLVINEQLLSPPYSAGGLSEHLKEILINSLLEVWLHASVQYFPPPSMWKTLQELCMSWRHHNAMIEYWSSTVLMLTRKVIKYLYGNSFPLPPLKSKKNEVQIPAVMNKETLLQTWFRILHIISNPVDLCNREIISDTGKFKEFALSCQDVTYPSAHPCLDCLPEIFLQAMKGIAVMVNTFLCITTTHNQPVKHNPINAPVKGSSPSASKKREIKTLSTGLALGLADNKGLGIRSLTMPSRHSSGTSMTGVPMPDDEMIGDEKESQTPASSLFSKSPSSTTAPSVDSVLDLYGAWLFDAAFAKVDMKASYEAIGDIYAKCCETSENAERNIHSPRKISVESSSSIAKKDYADDANFEPGRAEAFGALCRIFCSPRAEKSIRPVYLSRFYLAIATGLLHDETCTGHILCSILLNAPDLLRVDLQGVQVLLPHLLAALEIVLSKRQINVLKCPVSITDLRRAAIHLLVSMLCLPLHFQNLPIQDMTAGYQKKTQPPCDATPTHPAAQLTFLSLKPRITRLLLDALQIESDSYNVQILLGGVSLIIQDTEIAQSLGIAETISSHHIPITEDKELPNWTDFSARQRGRASTGGSSMISEAGSISMVDAETEDKLTFLKVSSESYDPATISGLFVQMTHLLCNKLVVTRSSKWKPDLHVTLASFEVLSGLAQLSMQLLDQTECKSTIHWLCDYVSYQANKPATHHSRDLHSMIVAAFHCIKTWVVAHPWLMDAEDCLQAVMEVVELGISGSKSKDARPEPGQEKKEPPLKGEKELKPVSFRVREAAEGLLTCIMEHLGCFPSPCGPAAMSSLLNEETLLEYSRNKKRLDKNDRQFRYFVIRDNTLILGLLEDSLEEKDRLPTVGAIIRAPTGRHVWTMELRQFSRKKHGLIEAHLTDPGRPMPRIDRATAPKPVTHRYFPPAVDNVPLTKADRSIPDLDDILDDKLYEVQDHMKTLMQKQAEHEAVEQCKVNREKARLRFPSDDTESIPLEPCEKFHASRLLLSHLGLLTVEGLKGNPENPSENSLFALDSTREGFRAALEALDTLPTRTQDTVFVFYIKNGQHEADEIIENEISSCKHSKLFVEFLLSLGWPVDVETHPGWTGNIHEAWTPADSATADDTRPKMSRDKSKLANSMSTITSSTSTMGIDGDVTHSSDEDSWLGRDRFLTCREQLDNEDGAQKDSLTQESSFTDSVTLVDSDTGADSVTREDSVTRADSVTGEDSVARDNSVTHEDSETSAQTVTQQPDNNSETSPEGHLDKELNQILYYADISREVAFVVPSLLPHYQRFRKMIVKAETSDEDNEESEELPRNRLRARSESMGSLEISSSSTSSMDMRAQLARQTSDAVGAFGSRMGKFSDGPVDTGKPIVKPSAHSTSSETNVIVAWLEHFPDHACFPIDDLLLEMDFGNTQGGSHRGLVDKDTVVIFIHILHNGLYRVHIRSTIRSPIGGPLLDGMVVSRRALGAMVRQTAMNIVHRRRLEIDTYSPPQVCRKLKIQDIVKKYRKEMSVPEFYVSLFGEEH